MLIKNGCATLRAIEKKDFDLLFYLINAPEIEEKIGGWNFPISSYEQEKWMNQYMNTSKNIKLMIELVNGKTIGMMMLSDIDWKNRTALLEYKISAPAEERIKGDMLDASFGMLRYAFDELGMNCITAAIMDDNIFSLKLARKIGFIEEGKLRERIYKNGKFKNQMIFSILRKEYNDTVFNKNGEHL